MRLRILLMAAWLPGCAHAQLAPERYVDPQGVEIIVNRNAVNALPAAAPAAQGREKPAAPASTPALPAKASWRVPPDEQAQRDRDRVGILTQELDAEMRAFADKKALSDQQKISKTGGRDPARINEELHEHQRNIQAILAELRRAKAVR